MSFIYMTNKTSTRTEPCGTLLSTSIQLDSLSFRITRCFLPLSQSSIQPYILPPIPCALTLAINLLWGTLSKAFPNLNKLFPQAGPCQYNHRHTPNKLFKYIAKYWNVGLFLEVFKNNHNLPFYCNFNRYNIIMYNRRFVTFSQSTCAHAC